jgi:hypothetical protein
MSQVLQKASDSLSADHETQIFSYYRGYAAQCRTAASNSPNSKQRTELQKMVQVWKDFAEMHERMTRESGNDSQINLVRRPIKSWI